MKQRRSLALLGTAVLLSALGGCSLITSQQTGGDSEAGSCATDFPNKPLTIITHASPSGGTEAKLIRDIINNNKLSPEPVVVEHDNGGAGATALLTADKANDHTMIVAPPVVFSSAVRGGIGVDLADFHPISLMALDSNVWLVRADAKWNSLDELMADAKAHPGDVSVGFGSIGSMDHILSYDVGRAYDAELTLVNHDGSSDAILAMLAGDIDVASLQPGDAIEYVKSGDAKVIGVFQTDQRLPAFPDVPTASELGVDVGTGGSPRMIFGAPAMCPEGVAYMEGILKKVYDTPEWQDFLATSQIPDSYLGAADSQAFLDQFIPKMTKLIKDMGLEN